jgi:hypothetical protein
LTNAQDKVIAAESLDTTRTLVLSGRPLRLIPNDWIRSWEKDPMKVKEFCDKGMLGLLTHGAMDSHTLGYKRLRKAPPLQHQRILSSRGRTGRTGRSSLAPRIVPLQHDLKAFGSEDLQIRIAIFDAAPCRQFLQNCVRLFGFFGYDDAHWVSTKQRSR